MVTNSECREDLDQRDEYAGGAERRESCECGSGQDVEGAAARV